MRDLGDRTAVGDESLVEGLEFIALLKVEREVLTILRDRGPVISDDLHFPGPLPVLGLVLDGPIVVHYFLTREAISWVH
jgi:hypothetical protein